MMNLITLHEGNTVLKISQSGWIVSLQYEGQELLREKSPLLVIEYEDNTERVSREVSLTESGNIRCICGKKCELIELEVLIENGYFRFSIQDIRLPEVKRVRICELRPKPVKYCGTMGGMFSDDRYMVCLRSFSLKGSVEVQKNKHRMYAYAEGEFLHDHSDIAFGLAAAPRTRITGILKTMTEKEPVPKSLNGGAWTLESEIARGSYVFADLKAEETEDWIRLAKCGHFSFIHIHAWWNTLGHYEINRDFYPNGREDMKKAVEKIHAAGLKASFHTLTACIEPNDSWITPVPADDLICCAHYTLSENISEQDDVIYIHEKPIPGHELVWSYSCNSNAVKIGNEIILYSEISYQKPYCFKQCRRGAFGTTASSHRKGEKASYLQSRYLAFYPEPDGKTADALADAIADQYRYFNMDGMYFDGSEGMRSRYGTDVMRWKIFQRLPGNAVIEASNWNHNNWWFHTRLGAWDHAAWALKSSHEVHVRNFRDVPAGNLLLPQMGWWAVRGPVPGCRGQFTDELEYFMMKNLGIDAPMSLQELRPAGIQWNERIYEMLTILGWYERFRLARYFRQQDLQRLQADKREFQLRMNNKGSWLLYPLRTRKIKLTEQNPDFRWTFQNEHKSQPLKARIECLYTLDCQPEKGVKLTDFSRTSPLVKQTGKNVSLQISSHAPNKGTAFHKLRMKAENHGRIRNGAWACARMEFAHPYLSTRGGDGFGVWIKGDSSGALLNFQFKSPMAYHNATAEHYVKIDFSGWKYCMFLFRERDAESMPDYHWPYPHSTGDQYITRVMLDKEHIEFISLYLNCIPSHGSTCIEISDLTAFPQKQAEFSEIVIAGNHRETRLPFQMQSGDYAEINEDGTIEYFSEQGRLLNRYLTQPLEVVHGRNTFRLKASASNGDAARTEFTVFTRGVPFGKKSEKINWDHLQTEYELPRIILKEDGRDNVWQIHCRDENGCSPKDMPALDFELEAVSAGEQMEEKSKSRKVVSVDSIASPAEYQVGEKNHYERYLANSENGATAKPLVSYELKAVPSRLKKPSGALRFEAVSARGGDNMGWASAGRHFAKPLNLSGQAAIGIRLRSCVSSAKLNMQLVDSEGKSFEAEIPLCDRNWHYNEFPLDQTGIDLSRIQYIIYTINDIMATDRVWVEIDEVTAVSSCSFLEKPELTINDKTVEFPCQLRTGDILQCSDGKNFVVKNSKGKVRISRPVNGAFPPLHAGKNSIRLNFEHTSSQSFRVIARIVKTYK